MDLVALQYKDGTLFCDTARATGHAPRFQTHQNASSVAVLSRVLRTLQGPGFPLPKVPVRYSGPVPLHHPAVLQGTNRLKKPALQVLLGARHTPARTFP